jgi:hypothetical protein
MKLTTHLYLMPRIGMHRAILPLPQVFTAQCLIKHRDNFTFTFGSYNYEVNKGNLAY